MEQSKPSTNNTGELPKTPEELEQLVTRAVLRATDETSQPPDTERKWALSNILFVIFSLSIGALIGYFFDYFQSKQQEETYSLQIAYSVGGNLIAWDKYARDKVVVTYKSDAAGRDLTVRSYYSIQGKILNSGNKKFQNLTFRFVSDKDLYLIKNPQFSIHPKRERPYLEIKQNPQTGNSEDEWIFSELALGEYIEFQYLALSDKLFDVSPKLTIVPKQPRDESYDVSYEEKIETDKEREVPFFNKKLADFNGYDLMMISFFVVAPVFYIFWFVSYMGQRRER